MFTYWAWVLGVLLAIAILGFAGHCIESWRERVNQDIDSYADTSDPQVTVAKILMGCLMWIFVTLGTAIIFSAGHDPLLVNIALTCYLIGALIFGGMWLMFRSAGPHADAAIAVWITSSGYWTFIGVIIALFVGAITAGDSSAED